MSAPKKVKKKSIHKTNIQLPTLHPHAAGIDIGATQIQVAVPWRRRSQTGPHLHHLHRRPARLARLVAQVRCADRGHGIHQRLLDCPLSNPRSRRLGSLSGQRPALQKSPRPQDRHQRLPMAPIPPLRRLVARQLPSSRTDLRRAFAPAPSGHAQRVTPAAMSNTCKKPSPK